MSSPFPSNMYAGTRLLKASQGRTCPHSRIKVYAPHICFAAVRGRLAPLVGATGARAAWDGGHPGTPRNRGRPGGFEIGRQCRGRRRGGRLRAGSDAPLGGEYRRGRLHADSSGGRARHVHRFPRTRAGRGLAKHVHRAGWQGYQRKPNRISRSGRSGFGARLRIRFAQIRQQAVGGAGASRCGISLQGLCAFLCAGAVAAQHARIGAVSRVEPYLSKGRQVL